MPGTDSITLWIRELQAGAHEAARPLYDRYFERLIRLAHSKLRGVPLRAAGAEDVAAHAFASFCRRLEEGAFPQVNDRDDLWRLLARITVNKALKLKRYHGAAGRDREQGERALEKEPGRDLPPDLLAEAGEEFQRLLDCLPDDTLRSIALWRLEGYSNEEIATRLSVVPRSVERKLRRIRSIWRPREVDDEHPPAR
jgi:DNA-directed RNA polymerase specialized sigma24 family protein